MKITPVEPILVHMLQASMVRSAPQPAVRSGHDRAKKHEKEQAAANQRAPAQQTSR